MSKDNNIYIEHILKSIKLINEYIKDHNQTTFLSDTKTQDAVIRQFEIIGEATKQVSRDFRKDYPDIPWEDMAGMRDKLIHDYIDVDLYVVWKTAKEDISFLHEKLRSI